MKKIFKKAYKTQGFKKVLCWLIANYIRLVHYTSRKTYAFEEAAMPYLRGELPCLYAFWHGRLLLMPMLCPPNRHMNVLISTHNDGEIISLAMHNFGFKTIRGSSSRGGGAAAVRVVKALQEGENVSITPDGPRGPAMKMQPGIASIAEMVKMPVICVTFSASRHKRMRSWDRFMVALPFGKIYYNAVLSPAGAPREALENAMVRIVEEADSQYAII